MTTWLSPVRPGSPTRFGSLGRVAFAPDGAKATRLPHATIHTNGAGRELARFLPAGQDRGLDSARAQSGATDFMLCLAVYCLLLARLTGERDILTILSGRERTVRLLDEIRAEKGDDPADWIPPLLERA